MCFHFVGDVVLSVGQNPPAKVCACAGPVEIECSDMPGTILKYTAWVVPHPSSAKVGASLRAPAWCARPLQGAQG
eukprot:714456-Pyramimonas_sp.AAC.1